MVTTYKKNSVLVPLLYTSYVEACKLSRVDRILIASKQSNDIHF